MYKKQKVTRKTDKSNVLRQYKRPAGKVKISESVSISNSFSASGGIMAQLSRQKFNIFIRTKFTLVVRSDNFFRFFLSQSTCMVSWPTFLAYSAFSLRSSASFSRRLSSRLLSKAREALARNSFFQLRRRFGWICILRTIFIFHDGIIETYKLELRFHIFQGI